MFSFNRFEIDDGRFLMTSAMSFLIIVLDMVEGGDWILLEGEDDANLLPEIE